MILLAVPGRLTCGETSLERRDAQFVAGDGSDIEGGSGTIPLQAGVGEDFPLKVVAASWEQVKERLFARGNVEIQYRGIRLFAERVELNTETKDVLAEGNVVIQLPQETVSAEKIVFNLDSGQGRVERAFGMIQPTIFYEADSLERKADNLYSFTKGRFTSCTQPVPRWNFSSRRANFKKDDYLEMWGATFSIKKIPVFYLPYLRYPLDKERSTGFLMPQVGYSGPKGFFYGQGFYWAIARNMDATFNLDYYSARGIGAGVEYRYLFGGGTGGDARLYYFRFKNDPERGKAEPPDAYIIRLNHNQQLPFGFGLASQIDYQASFDFLREFDNNFRRALVSNRVSQVYLARSWSLFNFSARASQFETYFTQIGNSIVTRYLPQVSLNSFRARLAQGLPLYFSLASSFSRWQHGWKSEYEKGRQFKMQNISLRPELSVPFSGIPWLTIDSSFSVNANHYSRSYKPNTRRPVDEPLLSMNYVFGADATGPVFYKIYDLKRLGGGSGDTRVKHIIEPFFSYRYESPVSQRDRIITPYGFFRHHQLEYGVTNRVLVKVDDSPREVITWGLGQTFYLADEESPLSIYRTKDGVIPKFSDITSYMRFYPGRRYSFDFSAGYNTYSRALSSVRLGANVNSPADSVFLSVSWFKSINPWYRDILWDRHQVGVWAGVKIPRLGVEVLGEVDFNIAERKMLYSGMSFVYHYQCLDLRADVCVFFFREKPETQFKVSVGLGNIGKTTDFLGGLELK